MLTSRTCLFEDILRNLFAIGIGIAVGAGGVAFAESSPTSSDATTRDESSDRREPIVRFEPPTMERLTDSRGGATRPVAVKCSNDETYLHPLTALLPKSGIGLTAKDHPTLFVYIPQTSATHAHLALRDESEQGVFQTTVPLMQTNGILAIQLPSDSPSLAIDETYQWSLALLCQPAQTDIPSVEGVVRRVKLDRAVASALPSQTPLMQAVTYGREGVWYDTLAIFAEVQQLKPYDVALATNWKMLLQIENLGNISDSSLIN